MRHTLSAAGARHDASKLLARFNVANWISCTTYPSSLGNRPDICFLDGYVYLVIGMIKGATHSKIESDNQIEIENTTGHRIFLLSPAYAGGERARMILSDRAEFELARKLRSKRGAPIAEVFIFLSGLYFRAKIAYATAFARPATGIPGVFVITPTRGLVNVRTRIRLDDLREFATVDIHNDDPRYRAPIERDALVLTKKLPAGSEVILLGSIATGKYTNVLLASFGDRLLFPVDFVGRGDMSRGGLMLRSAVDRQELPYIAVAGAIVNGKRPPKLVPRRYQATFR
jgi:hypothetical protein